MRCAHLRDRIAVSMCLVAPWSLCAATCPESWPLARSERTGAESLVVSSLEILLVRLQCAPNDLHTRVAWWRQSCCGDTRSVSAQLAQSCIDLAVARVLQALFRCDPEGYCFVCCIWGFVSTSVSSCHSKLGAPLHRVSLRGASRRSWSCEAS